jgi:biopolymer transport protein ExbB/TolQ
MKTEDWALIFAAGFIAYLLNEKKKDTNAILKLNNQNNHLINFTRNQSSSLNRLNAELRKTIEQKNNLPEEIKKDLNKLISDFDKLDKNIAEELISISSLISIDQKPKALFSLAKIIENLLKKIFGESLNFKKLIDKAKEQKMLTTEEHHFAHGIRELRNKEGHELNVKVENYLSVSSFMVGIGIISKIKLLPTKNIVNAG